MAASFRTETLVLGVGLTAVGVVSLLGNMGLLDTLGTLRRFWPSILVLWGTLEIVGAASHKNRLGAGRSDA